LLKTSDASDSKIDRALMLFDKHRSPTKKAAAIKQLFFYPRVKEGVKLEKKQSKTSKKEGSADVRTNNLDDFYNAMARHLYITFAAYPEVIYPDSAEPEQKLKQAEDTQRDEIIRCFVELSVQDGWQKHVKLEVALKEVVFALSDLHEAYVDIGKQPGWLDGASSGSDHSGRTSISSVSSTDDTLEATQGLALLTIDASLTPLSSEALQETPASPAFETGADSTEDLTSTKGPGAGTE